MKRVMYFLGLTLCIFVAGIIPMFDIPQLVKVFGVAASVGAANVLGFIEGLTT